MLLIDFHVFKHVSLSVFFYFLTLSAQSFQDRSELSEYIDQLLEKIKDKESSLREADDDTTSMRIALERHYEHIVQKLRKQTANLKVVV